jgi:hypothetical protein
MCAYVPPAQFMMASEFPLFPLSISTGLNFAHPLVWTLERATHSEAPALNTGEVGSDWPRLVAPASKLFSTSSLTAARRLDQMTF